METKNTQSKLEAVEKALKDETQRMTRNMFHLGTPQQNFGKRGIGITRKNKDANKKAVKTAKSQRKTNRKIANKKFRPTGSKQRK